MTFLSIFTHFRRVLLILLVRTVTHVVLTPLKHFKQHLLFTLLPKLCFRLQVNYGLAPGWTTMCIKLQSYSNGEQKYICICLKKEILFFLFIVIYTQSVQGYTDANINHTKLQMYNTNERKRNIFIFLGMHNIEFFSPISTMLIFYYQFGWQAIRITKCMYIFSHT